MSDTTRRQEGFAIFSEVMQFTPPDMPGDLFLDSTIEHLFGAVWARPGLGVRERRLVTLTILMGLGNEMTLRLHFGAAMKSGDLSDTEIDELILHVAHYGGWPQAAVASQVVARCAPNGPEPMGAAPTRRLALPLRPHVRRSQAERSAATRAKIIDAVVDVIARHGFQRLTAQQIAQRAGVTWGAVQHHFGGKDQLLLAVLEDSFARFADRLDPIAIEGTSLAARAALFVDLAWDHFRGRHYRATFEILLNYLGREEHHGAGDWRLEMSRAWDRVWSRVFADARLPRKRSLMLQHFTVSALSGLASTLMLHGSEPTLPKWELDVLKATLLHQLTAG